MPFLESPRFPECISSGSRGGPKWRTVIAMSDSGFEQRDIKWKDALHSYNAAFGVRNFDYLEQLKEFFMSMRGSAYSFRYKDWADFKSCAAAATITAFDQPLGTGDGVETNFQLIKRYVQGYIYDRPIKKPVVGTTLIAIQGIIQPTGWNIDTTTGIVTFDTPPADQDEITSGFEFDVPARFGSDELDTQLELYKLGSTTVSVIEERIE